MEKLRKNRVKRRSFLAGLIATPFVVRTGTLMPVKPPLHAFAVGDLVISARGRPLSFVGARLVTAVENGTVYLDNNSYGPARQSEPQSASSVSLFHGLPGNRVNNPSMKHRLVYQPGRIGLRYIGDPARIDEPMIGRDYA